MSKQNSTAASPALRWAVIASIAGVALFASYQFAVARNNAVRTPAASASPTATAAVAAAGTPVSTGGSGSTSGAAGGAGCACCGGGASAPSAPISGAAEVTGDVQKISVDVSKGYYDPNQIELKAGVPAEITFGQATGCLGAVQSQDLGFYQNLSAGPATVKLPALKAGTYTFSCGMQMVFGTIVVK